MLLSQTKAQELLDHSGEPDPRKPGQARSQFRVEKFVRPHAELGEAGEILARRVQDPFDALQGVVDDLKVLKWLRIDEPGARALPPDLHQESPLAVSETRGPFRVHSGRARSGGDSRRAA